MRCPSFQRIIKSSEEKKTLPPFTHITRRLVKHCFQKELSHYLCSLWRTLYRKSYLCIPRNEIARPHSQFLHSWYSQDWSAYLAATKRADQSWEYVNHSQIHECGNWETEHYNSVLEITSPRSIISGITLIGTRHFYWILTALNLQCRYTHHVLITHFMVHYKEEMSQVTCKYCRGKIAVENLPCVTWYSGLGSRLGMQNLSRLSWFPDILGHLILE